MSTGIEYGEHGRCEATAKSTGERCGRPAVGSHGKCDMHGGKSPKGRDHGGFKHGLFSDYLDPEDRDTIDALEEFEDAAKLDELINWRLARLRRYLREMSEEDKVSFWDAFREVVDAADEVGDSEIRELARMLDKNNSAVQEEIDLIRKLIKDRNKIAEGEDVNVSWREMLADASQSER